MSNDKHSMAQTLRYKDRICPNLNLTTGTHFILNGALRCLTTGKPGVILLAEIVSFPLKATETEQASTHPARSAGDEDQVKEKRGYNDHSNPMQGHKNWLICSPDCRAPGDGQPGKRRQ